MDRTAKMNRFYEITNVLLSEMAEKKDIELSKYLEPQACETLNDVYEQALSSLCNRQGMRNNIKFERNAQPKEKIEKRSTLTGEIEKRRPNLRRYFLISTLKKLKKNTTMIKD